MGQWRIKANALRKERGVTQAELAAHLGVSVGTVNHWFTGRNPAPVPMIEAMAEYLKVPVAYFFLPENSYCITDPRLITAVKMLEMLPEPQQRPFSSDATASTQRQRSTRRRRVAGKGL